MVTIKQIADLAGVSRGTVDRVLNNRGSFNPETARRVREIAQALHYQPNKAALALAAQKKKLVIGVILFGTDHNHPFFDELMEGVQYQADKLAGYGCKILCRRVNFEISAQLHAIDDLEAAGIHGLVISPYNSVEISSRINRLTDDGIPVITTNTDISGSQRLLYIGSNYYEGGCTAAGLMGLITGGKARTGIITGSSMVLCHTERIAGFKDTIRARYPGISIVDTVQNHDDDLESYRVTSQLLYQHPELDSLFFTAAGVYGGCQAVLEQHLEHKRKIIVFDAVPATKKLLNQGIIAAAICQQPFQQGSRPVKLLFDYLTTGILPENPVQYTETIIKIRENC